MFRLATVLLALAALPNTALAEAREIRIAQGWGIGFLPLLLMQKNSLLERHVEARGLPPVKVAWSKFAGGSNMNDALLSGRLDVASGGVPPFITLWSRAAGANQVKIAAVMSQMPLLLNTISPGVKTIGDFTDKDKIALPAVKTSNQAVLLAMAAKTLGDKEADRISRLTVSMSHADATVALLNGNVTAHFASPPFQYQQLRDPRVRTILSSTDVMDGPFTFTVIWTTVKFHDENPKLHEALTAAMAEAIDTINADKRAAAALYIEATNSKESVGDLFAMISDPNIEFTKTPRATKKYAEFVHELGLIKTKPNDWRELFFESIHKLPGS